LLEQIKIIEYKFIKKSGVDFTRTSEPSEDLPLPHTKGTKPAPSWLKVKV